MPIVTVQMLTGRTAQQKKDLAMTLAAECARICGISVQGVKVVPQEMAPENWCIDGLYGPDFVAARKKAAAAAQAAPKKAAPAKKAAAKKATAPKKAPAKKPVAKKPAPKKAGK
jgi:4-oxalocrotonate tautomerase family enzyme